MQHEMVMPKMGESITEGTIIKWLKNVGDVVENDEIILEISTDKVDSEIPTPIGGKISKLLANEGDTVEVGKVIAFIETEAGEKKTEEVDKQPKKESPVHEKTEKISQPEKVEKPQVIENKIQTDKHFSPVVLNIARTEGISMDELERISGTGIDGRVTKKDVLKYIDTVSSATISDKSTIPTIPAASPMSADGVRDGVEIIPMDHIRKRIAEHMVKTVHTSPHVGLFIEVDMSNVVKIRERNKNSFLKNEGFNLTFLPFISEATTRALKEFPYVNASLDGDNIVVKHYINLGIAVATEQGLIVPVIKNCEALNLSGIARAINDLALRARTKKLKPDEVSNGTFSISNFGVYGIKIGFPLINQPQVGILGVGALNKRAVVIDDAIAIRPMMDISLTFDHRLIDGALGSQFLQKVALHLQDYDPNMKL